MSGAADLLAGVDPWLVDAIGRLTRGDSSDLDGLLLSVGEDRTYEGTRTRARVHFVRRDANDRPMVKQLAKHLAYQAVDYCIPRSRILEARARMERTGSAEWLTRLGDEAKALFVAADRSGEAGELMVYLLLERLLGIPQLLCKMSLKTSSQMHFHGSDGVHIKALDNGRIGLYWCESKLHADASSAIDSCFESIAPYLLDDGDGVSQRDLLLIRDQLDTGNPELDRALVDYFIDGSGASAKREIRGATLVGFSLDDYPDPLDDDGETIRAEVEEAIEKWHERMAGRVASANVASFDIEVFCLPVPSVDKFRGSFREHLGI